MRLPQRSSAGFASSVVVALLLTVSPYGQEAERSVIPVASQWPGSTGARQIDLSDDGKYVVYQTNRGDGWKLFIHEIGQPTSREIPGLGDTPYFGEVSPSGDWLLFGKRGWIWKAPLAGGAMSMLYASNNWKTVETNDSFLIARGTLGLWRVKADGSRQMEQVAAVDASVGATNYGPPSLLPDGKGILTSVGVGTGIDLRRIGVISLPGGQLTLLDELGVNPKYSASGHILYTQGSTLKALPFDLDTLRVLGPAATVIDGVHVYSNQESQFDISRNGVLAYVRGRSDLNRVWPTRLTWVDRSGNETPFDTTAEKTSFGIARISPDRRFLVAEIGTGLGMLDRRSGVWSVFSQTTDSAGTVTPTWSRDSQTVLYSRNGVLGRHSVAPEGTWQALGKDSAQRFWGLSLSGEDDELIGTEWLANEARWRLARVTLTGTPHIEPMFDADGVHRRSPALSPDGKWLAYVEKIDGMDHVYVQPFPNGGAPVLVSTGGTHEAAEPMWGSSSAELFYRDAVHVVSVELDSALRVIRRTPLFEVRGYRSYLNRFAPLYHYDWRTDRFLMVRLSIPNPPPQDIHVIHNAFELLKRLAPRR